MLCFRWHRLYFRLRHCSGRYVNHSGSLRFGFYRLCDRFSVNLGLRQDRIFQFQQMLKIRYAFFKHGNTFVSFLQRQISCDRIFFHHPQTINQARISNLAILIR